jgi:hypothetical protein
VPEVPKPADWAALPLFRKIEHYGAHLTAQHAPFADKLAAKEMVAALDLPGLHLPPTLRVLDGPDDLREEDLQPGRIVKASHGCKWNVVGGAGCDAFPLPAARDKLRAWAEATFASGSGRAQRQYDFLRPRFFVEQVVADAHAAPGGALCYMVRCVRGRPVSLSVGRTDGRQNTWGLGDSAFGLIKHDDPTLPTPGPALRRQLASLAAALAAPLEFVRADFYVGDDGRVYFSELTLTPAAGAQRFTLEVEMEMGRGW